MRKFIYTFFVSVFLLGLESCDFIDNLSGKGNDASETKVVKDVPTDNNRETERINEERAKLEREKQDFQNKIDEEKRRKLIVEKANLEIKFPPYTNAVAVERRVYFHSMPNPTKQLKSFIVEGQYCTVQKVLNGFGYIEFFYNNKTTKGWLNLKYLEPSDYYDGGSD
tara:strand:- start:103 stop:603 length:501 start_codon:yes stop_codon:yes gene_type:complete